MTISAKVILDSIALNGVRLTTFELTYPRFIHAELMTHRVFSRNAASSRAIPTLKKIERIRKDCAKPSEWGVNQKGMQSGGALDPQVAERAEMLWVGLGEEACKIAEILDEMGLHKQVANRLIEPWDHITTVVSTTKLNNHWKLRLELDPETGRPMPDPTYYELAVKWKAAFDASEPGLLYGNERPTWHLPYVMANAADGGFKWQDPEDWRAIRAVCGDDPLQALAITKKVSVGRVARTSYMRQGQGDIEQNIVLHDRLAKGGHWSPFEAVATPIDGFKIVSADGMIQCSYCRVLRRVKDKTAVLFRAETDLEYMVCVRCAQGHITSGNFVGWHQYRKDFENEAGGD